MPGAGGVGAPCGSFSSRSRRKPSRWRATSPRSLPAVSSRPIRASASFTILRRTGDEGAVVRPLGAWRVPDRGRGLMRDAGADDVGHAGALRQVLDALEVGAPLDPL